MKGDITMLDPTFSANLPHDLHAPLRKVADRLKTEPDFADALEAFLADDGSKCDAPADLNVDHVPDIMVLDAHEKLFVVLEGEWAQLIRVLAALNGLSAGQVIWSALALYTAAVMVKESAEKAG
jgi:hypothetical protein